jgi:hypothetical protein
MSAEEFGYWRVMASEEWMNGEEDFMRWAARRLMSVIANGLYPQQGRVISEDDFIPSPWAAQEKGEDTPITAEALKAQLQRFKA